MESTVTGSSGFSLAGVRLAVQLGFRAQRSQATRKLPHSVPLFQAMFPKRKGVFLG